MKNVLLIMLLFSSSLQADDISRLSLAEIMYYRFQDNNFDAITSYLLSQEKKQLKINNNDKAFIASVYLNYDIHSQAKDMLSLLLNNPSPEIRSVARYYLGRMHYRNRRVQSALDAFSAIGEGLPEKYRDIKNIMYGIMAYKDRRFEKAKEEFSKISRTSEFRDYVEYNIILTRYELDKNAKAAGDSFESLIKKIQGSPASDVFVDLLYLSSGFEYIEREQFKQALDIFSRVSAESVYSSRALQGMVYSAYRLGDYDRALNLSIHLLDMSVGIEAIHYAYSIIPHILKNMDKSDKAMAFYRYSVQFFDQQRVRLNGYIADIKKGKMDEYLLNVDKILTAEEWLNDPELGRLLRDVSTLTEWRDAVYKYNEMKYLAKRLDDALYEMVIIESDLQAGQVSRYKELSKKIEKQKKKVERSIKVHQQQARNYMAAELKKQQAGITRYLSNARLALARYYDEKNNVTPFGQNSTETVSSSHKATGPENLKEGRQTEVSK